MPAKIPPRPSDTDADAENVQVALLRAMPIERRLAMALRLSADVISNARRALARAWPEASPEELTLRFVEPHYGADLAAGLRSDLRRRKSGADPAG
jgi:hypothetical protein